ncbi:energy transducer TonB, partial [Vineibacter terrae]|uniref:energy transducer TonB family protein n=1 Tax=Vineibacter terrae TaxID=2586908 RepID=UPI002E351725
GPKQEEAEPPAVETEVLARQLPEPEPPEPVTLPQPDRLAEMLPPPPDVPPEVVIEVPPPKPPPPKPKPEVKPKPAEKPVRKPEPKPRVAQTTAPAAAPAPAAQATAAPPPGIASQPSPDAVRRWQATLVAHLQRHKRYPGAARRDGEEGVAYLRFTMDRNGMVLGKRLDRGSGHASLDQETLALVERAQPLPQPPADMQGDRFEFVVPVQFQLR